MSYRYTWAVDGRTGRGGRASERLAWSLARSELPATGEVPPVPADGDGGEGGELDAVAPAGGDDGLWQPVGPSTSLRGFVDSDIRVAGRVNDIALSPDGTRAYAASALGGLWYSGDSGVTWEPVGAWRTSDRATVAASSNALTGGAVHVNWGANEGADEVWLGTGEALPGGRRDSGYVGNYGGIGVLSTVGPVATVRANPLADPWGQAQAQPRPAAGGQPAYAGLGGHGFFKVLGNPDALGNPALARDLLAATTAGLHRHNPAAPAGTDPWSLVSVPLWEATAAGSSGSVAVTDVAWTPAAGAHGARIWVTVIDRNLALTGLWFSTDNGATFSRIALPGMPARPQRFSIGWHPNHPDTLYVLTSGPILWRIDGTLAPPGAGPAAVGNVPTTLFGRANDISFYAIAAAVDPANSARVLVGGAAVTSPIDAAAAPGPAFAAALYLLTVAPTGGGRFATDYVMPADAGPNDPTWVGSEVHADVHRITWEAPGGVNQVWIGSDGGVSRSLRGGARGTYAAISSGMAVSEPGFLANHPTSPGPMLTGMQDNGTQLRIGEGVWRQAVRNGDSGGVAFDPGAPGRFVAQTSRSWWDEDGGQNVSPTIRMSPVPGATYQAEDGQAAFYSYAAVTRTAAAAPVTRLAVGTDRVWFSELWGRTRWDGAVWRKEWVTLPTATDPRAGDASPPAAPNALLQDQLPPGPRPWAATAARPGIRVLRWQSPTVLLAVTEGAVHSLTDPGAPGAWVLAQVAARLPVPVGGPPAVVPAPAVSPALPAFGSYNDLAVDPTLPGAFYLATGHPLEPLWWWDGARCHPTTLGTLPAGTRSPAYSVVVDPAAPTIVYVGTTVGVWQGTLTPPAGGNPPVWVWTQYSNGLPEAAVQDLAIGTYPRPGGGAPLRLLRAALQARGLWEVDLDAAGPQQTYLRVHPYDTRRLLPTPRADPLTVATARRRTWHLDWAYDRNRDHRTGGGAPRAHPDGTAVTDFLWHSSPDVSCRPAPVSAAPGAVPLPQGLPWVAAPADRFWLWSLQTALRGLPPGQFPDAPLVVPDGRWTQWWVQRLRAIRAAFVPALPNPALAANGTVDAALWNEAQVQAAFWAPPWSTPEPSEADLVERVLGMATPRTTSINAAAVRAASSAVMNRRYVVDVCVHHRGRVAAAAGDAAVVLLRTVLPLSAPAWNAVAAPAIAGLAAALDGLPADTSAGPAPNALPGYVPPAGWAFVDAARPARRPRQPVAAGEARVVSFDADFSADPLNTDVLLLALVHRRQEPVALAAGALRDSVLASSHAAARSVRVRS
jgi:hypothetical protein